MRHASTSAWARSTKMRGRGAVESRRREMRDNEALRRELAKKQEHSSSEESDSDESREELIAKAKASLGECGDAEEPGSALLNMKFMVKAREAQRARAREDAEKLLEELREKSDSESFDDEKEKLLNVSKAMEADQLKERIKNMTAESEVVRNDFKVNMARLENNLKLSRNANQHLKNDYDLLQEKFDKHMKATNNINQDLKEEIERLL